MSRIANGYTSIIELPSGVKQLHARDLAKYNCEDDPLEFFHLNGAAQQVLLQWIASMFKPASRAASMDSYGLKHVFERAGYDGKGPGFYVTNASFKGGMILAGHLPTNPKEQNWRFKIQAAQPCAGRLAQHPYGSTPCPKQPDMASGLCRYHANRKAQRLPIDATVYETREEWIKAKGYDTPRGGSR